MGVIMDVEMKALHNTMTNIRDGLVLDGKVKFPNRLPLFQM